MYRWQGAISCRNLLRKLWLLWEGEERPIIFFSIMCKSAYKVQPLHIWTCLKRNLNSVQRTMCNVQMTAVIQFYQCVSPGFAAANCLDCSSAGGSLVCRWLLPGDLSPALLLVGKWSSETQWKAMLHSFCKLFTLYSKKWSSTMKD